MKKIILLNGPPGVGKDTIANILIEKYGGVNLKFTQPLRDSVCAIFGILDSELDFRKNRPIDPAKSNYRIRDAMIDIAEIVIKPNVSKDWFANILLNKINDQDLIIISDLGFIRELEVIYASLKDTYEFELWKIYRTGKDFARDSRNYVEFPIKTRNISNMGDLQALQELISL
jgi:dephospho-CoA kinase